MPFGFPQRANVASLSLRSYLRKVIRLQTLRRCFKEKHRHGRRTQDVIAIIFALCNEPYISAAPALRNVILWSEWDGGRSKSAEQIYAERLGFPKTSEASFWGSQRSEESPAARGSYCLDRTDRPGGRSLQKTEEVAPATLLFSFYKVLGGCGGLLSRRPPRRPPTYSPHLTSIGWVSVMGIQP